MPIELIKNDIGYIKETYRPFISTGDITIERFVIKKRFIFHIAKPHFRYQMQPIVEKKDKGISLIL
jgi:hypothetical protein